MYTARNGQEGLIRVKEHQPQTVFLDISMPHMDGTETLRLIGEINHKIRVIIISGYASAPLTRQLLQQGAYDFFQKPVDIKSLRDTVERLDILEDLNWSHDFYSVYNKFLFPSQLRLTFSALFVIIISDVELP